jgi:isopenicillin-N epimerase
MTSAIADQSAEAASTMAFGRPMRALFPLDPQAVYLNHGTVGVTPNPVRAAQQDWRERIERHPARSMLRELKPRLRAAADRVGARLGVPGEDLAFIDNATTGVNAVLRSLRFRPGDEILVTDHTYGAIAHTAQYVARCSGATVATATIPFPVDDEQQVVAAVAAALTPRTRVAVLDHITSETALLLPLAQIARLCRERGVALLVDGAHAPGQIPLDLPATGADWYVGNLHKWLFAPRGCGVLWTPKPRQAGLHPPVISWGLDKGLAEEFDWTGTRDPSAALSTGAALDFVDRLGGLAAIQAYIHPLARAAASRLAARWQGPLPAPASMTAAMALAPLPAVRQPDKPTADRLRQLLLERHDIEVPVIARAGRLWFRLSLQVYNDMADIDRLAEATEALLAAEAM